MTCRGAAAAAAALAGFALAIPSAAAAAREEGEPKPRCSTADVGGGDWPSYGHDLRQTRFQPRERVISAADAPLLTPEWSFSTTDAGGEGDITGTPIVSRGCVYAATTEGWVFALNADDGEVVWKRELPYGGSVTGSVTAQGRRIYVGISRLNTEEGCRKGDPCVGPYVAALGRRNGGVRWATRSLDQQPGSDLYGSPMIFKRTLMVGVSGGSAELGDEADRYAFQGSMLFVDTRKGRLLRKNWTIHPPVDPDDEYAGAGIWSTPAIDRKAKVAYVGTANPFKPQAEHDYANAVVKFDLNRDHRRRFARIIGSYKGNVDEYVPGLSELPCYDFPGNSPPYYPQGIGACGDIDLDFGAAPNLITGADGRKLVGAGQKSGVYHVFDAKTMEPVWTQIVGPPTAVGGIVGSTAYDGSAIYGPITVPGVVWSLAPGGAYRWAAPVGDAVHWGNPVAVANGVVYTVDLTGFLDAYDARSGAVLAKRPLMLGGSANPASLSWGGVSIARHMVFAAVGIRGLSEGHVIAFRRGGTSDVGDDAGETVGGLGGGGDDGGGGGGGGGGSPGGDPPIVAGPGAASTSYATPVATTGVGGPLDFVNVDVAKHDVTSVERGTDGRPLFSTPLIDLGERAPIEGLDRVSSGRSYEFFCTIHPGMRGRLAIR